MKDYGYNIDELNADRDRAVCRIVEELKELAIIDMEQYQMRIRGCSYQAALDESYERFKNIGEGIGLAVAEALMRHPVGGM